MQEGPKGWGLWLGSGFHSGGSVGTHFHLQGVGIGGRTGRDLGSNTFLEQLSALLVEAVKPTSDEVESAGDVEFLLQLADLIAEDRQVVEFLLEVGLFGDEPFEFFSRASRSPSLAASFRSVILIWFSRPPI